MPGSWDERTGERTRPKSTPDVEQATNGVDSSETILLEDKDLMRRVDECHSGDFVRENHPDRCPVCGNVEPGSPSCRHCGHRMARKGKNPCFCFQEIADTLEHQAALEGLVGGSAREEDGGVHEWVTVALLAEATAPAEAASVEVRTRGIPSGEPLGHVPPGDGQALNKALEQLDPAYAKSLLCRGLVQGGVRRQDGSRSAYTIRLLLPIAKDIPRAIRAALKTLPRP
jgi:hypothetical protein